MPRNTDVRSTISRSAFLLAVIVAIAAGGAGLRAGDGAGPPRAVAPATTILAPNGAAGDTFGRRLAVSGDRLIVGANGVDRGGVSDVGAAYVYRREGATWTHEATLQPEPTTVPLFFGWSVAIDGNTIVVGALGDSTGGLVNRGAAYVFVRGGTTWTQQAKLVIPDGQAGDEAGASVAISGNTAVVGAPYHDAAGPDAGAVGMFLRTGATWSFQAKVQAPPVSGGVPPNVPNFGRSLALRNTLLMVGASPDTVFNSTQASTGAAYQFTVDGTNFGFSARYLHPVRCPDAHFGAAVAVGTVAEVIAAPGQCQPPQSQTGAAYAFNVTFYQGELQRQAAQPGQRLGEGVATEGNTIVLGAPGGTGDPGGQRGSLTVFTRTGSWNEGPTLQHADAQPNDHFGASVAMTGALVFAGVPNDDVGANADQGSVRVFDLALLDTDEDGLPDAWERRYGLDPQSTAGINGAAGDPDGDGRTNLEEYQADTHPRNVAALTRYLAEGASTAFFDTRIAVANPGAAHATVLLRFLKSDGTIVTHSMQLPALSRQSILVDTLAAMANAEFSTVVETDALVVVDRTMWWDGTAYGTHAETAIDAPATTWYLAEGATHSGFNLFYLVQNPTSTPADLQVTYLLPAPESRVTRTYSVPANSRFNIWVNKQGSALASTDVSAVLATTNGVPVIVERAMYLDSGGLAFGAGHESAGIRTPATEWYLAEGATGAYFDLFVLIANPDATDAAVQARYLLPNGTTITKTYTVRARSRFNIWVDLEDPALADTAVSTIIASTNGVPLIVERAMWWPGPKASSWHEAHNSAGAMATGTKWAMAEGEIGGPANTQTYVLIANTGASAGTARVTLLFEGGGTAARDFPVGGNSRFNVDVRNEFPAAVGEAFGVIVETLGATPIPIVVERAMYSDARGVTWAAGTNALATRLQ